MAIAAAAGLTGWDGVAGAGAGAGVGVGVGVGVGNSDPGVAGWLEDGLPVDAVVLVVLAPLFASGVLDPEFAPLHAVRSSVRVMMESENDVLVFFMRQV